MFQCVLYCQQFCIERLVLECIFHATQLLYDYAYYALSMYDHPVCRHLVVGCAGNLCIWAARTGDLIHKFTVVQGKEREFSTTPTMLIMNYDDCLFVKKFQVHQYVACATLLTVLS